ncbi:hypothetical protein C8F04DRAFT_1387916 [Mycena alexandri]|uniref:Uncharacterized protein n=1 Tax=Mycena alexandri TaxID=1745969 RepID=A0AAD6TJD1_9AGAR|nr:hypothetical protein C8F04DRAFT_1387916 [Mycena alexandri]
MPIRLPNVPQVLDKVVGIGFHAELLHLGHHSIAQDPVQYPLTFSFDGNVERVGGIAFHVKSLHPGHQSIAEDPVQYPLMFIFDGNVERVGDIALSFRPEFVHSALHGLVYNTQRYPLTFIWDGDVGCVGGIAASMGSSMTPHDIPTVIRDGDVGGVAALRPAPTMADPLSNLRAVYAVLETCALHTQLGDTARLRLQCDEAVRLLESAEPHHNLFPPAEFATLQQSISTMSDRLCQRRP